MAGNHFKSSLPALSAFVSLCVPATLGVGGAVACGCGCCCKDCLLLLLLACHGGQLGQSLGLRLHCLQRLRHHHHDRGEVVGHSRWLCRYTQRCLLVRWSVNLEHLCLSLPTAASSLLCKGLAAPGLKGFGGLHGLADGGDCAPSCDILLVTELRRAPLPCK